MAILNALPSETGAVVAVIDPDIMTQTAFLSGAVDMSKYDRIMGVVMVGTMVSTSTVNAELQEATTSGGSYSAITGKAITQLTEAGGDSDKQAILNLRSDEMTVGHRFVKLWIDVNTANTDGAGIVFGFQPTHGPGTDNDVSSIEEILS